MRGIPLGVCLGPIFLKASSKLNLKKIYIEWNFGWGGELGWGCREEGDGGVIILHVRNTQLKDDFMTFKYK